MFTSTSELGSLMTIVYMESVDFAFVDVDGLALVKDDSAWLGDEVVLLSLELGGRVRNSLGGGNGDKGREGSYIRIGELPPSMVEPLDAMRLA